MNRFGFLCVGLAALLTMRGYSANPADNAVERMKASVLMEQGNFKEAFDLFSRLALIVSEDDAQSGECLAKAVECLQRLGRISEFDDFIEKVVAAHPKNRRLLTTAARQYRNVDHGGVMVAGAFERGGHRGGGRYVNSYERDRVRALQLMEQAMTVVPEGRATAETARFYSELAEMLVENRESGEAWRLQELTDLTALPDYDEGYYGRGGRGRGAPVGPDGTPVYHYRPASWQEAKSDGERWRWALDQAMDHEPTRPHALLRFAGFLRDQFDVQTMTHQPWFRQASDDDTRSDESGPYAVHTLGEDETIARLATGVKRFRLPEEFNFIRIYQQLASEKGGVSEQALNGLAQVFEDRRQYPKAAEYWRKSLAVRQDEWKQECLDQIVGNWGLFEPVLTQTAGKGASVEFRFRNGDKVHFEAHEIDVRRLLADVKDHLRSKPRQLEWETLDIGNIGHRIVTRNEQKYLTRRVAAWDLALTPRPDHFDSRITVATPLQRPGAYLLTARMEKGNTSRIVIWVADTAIVKKRTPEGAFVFVADAATGQPVPLADLDLFGYRQQWEENRRGGEARFRIDLAESTARADAQGQAILRAQDQRFQWIITATTPDGRFAYHGFTGVWAGSQHDAQYNEVKVFAVTDRPVYRPQQSVKFKFWINQAQYDREGKSPFAGQDFKVIAWNPRNEKVFEKRLSADDYGGMNGEFALEKEAVLGVYRIEVENRGGGSFRVEEYKKPEFEVKIEAPGEPIMLGEKITARITAKYYFGAPVSDAKVTYKVLRTAYEGTWYPVAYWDWFYGPGYGWFAGDYVWYPGWKDWGCRRPPFWWWPRPQPQPEVVAEAEASIGRDGTVNVEIDTLPAKALQGDTDHRYEITAEVTDQSRRTIVGQGAVLAARKPFRVYAWVNRGHYRAGDTIRASFRAQTLDHKPVQGKGELRLLRITYDEAGNPVEREAQKWSLDTSERGEAQLQIKASETGQYRLSYRVTDARGRTMEGGYVFCITGEGFDGSRFRFNDIEIVPDRAEYRPGDTVNLMLNTNRVGSCVLLFVRPSNGVYLPPRVVQLAGKSVTETIGVVKKDMPNFFVEAVTVSDGKVHVETREIIVPPESRVLNVEVTPSAEQYKPGEKGRIRLRLTDISGKPFVGSTVVSLYDKAVEYISGGSNVPEIKAFFWKWRRSHHSDTESNLYRGGQNLLRRDEKGLRPIGVFGRLEDIPQFPREGANEMPMRQMKSAGGAVPESAPMLAGAAMEDAAFAKGAAAETEAGGGEVEPTVRTAFADTALWVAALTTQPDGTAEVEVTMPENLTTWKARVWAMGDGSRVGEGTAEVITTKNLILRLQAPRFFVQKDYVVLSANVHNYLKTRKNVRVVLELEGGCLAAMNTNPTQTVAVEPEGEQRVDWRVMVLQPGETVIRMKALTDEESDAMEMKFPVYVHGMLKTESFTGVIRPEQQSAAITVRVPRERRPEQTRLEIRWSPTLAGAMVDALPYLADYPYGCTEQTLNRFLPAVVTQKVLREMGLDLKAIGEKRANLNAQEIGDDAERAKQWRRFDRNPVFDQAELAEMVRAGINRLVSMQCSDGGWGWFSGWNERSWPHTTAVVVHGLQIARSNGVSLPGGMIERGVEWLKQYQAAEVERLDRHARGEKENIKGRADSLDAFVYMVLTDEKLEHAGMREYLYRDRNELSVYAKAMFGFALHRVGRTAQRDMLIRNVEQYLVQDEENQTAYLRMPEGNWWWCWHGSEIEAHAYYLKLLAATDPKGEKAARLVKYLINNRKHATYWSSTRDTALCVEAFADFIRASGEDAPDMTLTVAVDGKSVREVRITRDTLFTFDNKLVLEGVAVSDGDHRIELLRQGKGPVYFNAYLTHFTLEDPITRAGLEIKVDRRVYKLVPVEKTVAVEGARGQALGQKVAKYERLPLANLAAVTSGDLVEVELEIESKNDYEYIVFEDMKGAGFEPVEVRSGYTANEMGAYVEFRDERTVFFVRALARGKHSVSYRLRAETPGRFSALPAKGAGMYAPELRANSDEIKLVISD